MQFVEYYQVQFAATSTKRSIFFFFFKYASYIKGNKNTY